MKVGVIGAGTMGSGIAQAFAMTDGYEVMLCDIKQEFADGGKAKIEKNMKFLVSKEKITQTRRESFFTLPSCRIHPKSMSRITVYPELLFTSISYSRPYISSYSTL